MYVCKRIDQRAEDNIGKFGPSQSSNLRKKGAKHITTISLKNCFKNSLDKIQKTQTDNSPDMYT